LGDAARLRADRAGDEPARSLRDDYRFMLLDPIHLQRSLGIRCAP
jgi:hypothetical protein